MCPGDGPTEGRHGKTRQKTRQRNKTKEEGRDIAKNKIKSKNKNKNKNKNKKLKLKLVNKTSPLCPAGVARTTQVTQGKSETEGQKSKKQQ